MESVLYERRGRGGWITLNRPYRLNACNPEMVGGICRHLDDAFADPQVAAIVITGSGERAFCAGADLGQAADQNAGPTPSLETGMAPVRSRCSGGPKPVIAAVNGLAVGGGLELVLACDLVIASDTARFGDGHANVGLVPGGGSSVRLPRRIGATRARHMIMTGQLFNAGTMLAWGLLNDVVAQDMLTTAVDALVADLSLKSPLSLRTIKLMINGGEHLSEVDALERERTLAALHVGSEDAKEGVSAFREKRTPDYRGR